MKYLPFFFILLTHLAYAQTEATADSLYTVRDYAAATPIYESLYQVAVTSDDKLRVGLNYAMNQQRQGEHELAITILEEVLADEAELERDSILALAYHKLGVSQYYFFRNTPAKRKVAIDSWQKALSIREAIYSPLHLDIIKGYRNLGTIYNSLLDYENAEVALKKALKLEDSRSSECTPIGVDLGQELGRVLTKKGDFLAAEHYLLTALECSKIAYTENLSEIADTYTLLTLLYKQQRQATSMIKFAIEGLAIIEKEEELELWTAQFYNNLGIAYDWQKDFNQAQKYYYKSLAINKKYGVDRAESVAVNYNNLAGTLLVLENYPQAMKMIKKSLYIYKKNVNVGGLSGGYNTKAEILFRQKKYPASLTAYQRSINYFIAADNLNYYKNPDPQRVISFDYLGLIQSLADKSTALAAFAEVENRHKNLTAALHTLDTVSILIDRVRTQYESDASKNFLTKQSKIIFEQALELCFQLAKETGETTYYERAFAYAERSKSVILLEAVKEATAKRVAGIPLELLAREQQLKRAIAAAEEELFITTEDRERYTVRNELLIQQRALENLVDTFEQEYADYYNLKYKFPLPTVQEVQQQLNQDQGVVEYFVGEKNIYAFYMDSEQFKTYRLPLDFNLNAWLSSMRTGITKPFLPHKGKKDWNKLYTLNAQRLYDKLLQPIFIDQVLPQQLQIIPDGILGNLPFDALLTETIPIDQIGQFGTYPYLQNQVQLSYNFSLVLAQEMSRLQRSATQQEILAFAPRFSNKLQPLQLNNTTIYLPEVTETLTATQAILKQFAGKAILADAANKSVFLQDAGNYAFLHLATHGQMNDENAAYSFIAFAQTGDTVQREELLFVNDIYNLNLPAEMVVLSACETGIGDLQNGEGIISLARAFSYAGAQSIITTLWKVNDQRTGQLMEYFYEELAKGVRKEVALYQAKNRLRADFAEHPYYWAGFIPIGNMTSIKLPPKKNNGWLLSGILVLSIGFLGGILYLQRRKLNR